MSQTIEERITSLKFDNTQFEAATQKTMATLEKLKQTLNFDGAAKSLQQLDTTGRRFSMAPMVGQIEQLAGKFTTLGIVGVTALTNIANRAVNAGIQLVKSVTIDPIKQGFTEYETQLNSVQTILANTASKGGTLKKVNAALLELNEYSDKTIYNFSEMARNIGTFTAAGVGLNTSTQAIKGIANLAAVSGSNAQQASTAMYQLSQAIAAGSVKLQDWNSVVNAGMGGEVFQNALKDTARAHGVAIDKMIKDEGSFRMTLQKGWLSSDILTETLSKFTGDLTDKQLKAMGYNEKQIREIQKMAQVAQDAATKVKTFSQLINTLQEAVGSGWAQTWQILFGDFEEAKKLFTDINNVLSTMIADSSEARNSLLKGWDDGGGRALLLKGLGKAFKNLMAIVKPIGEAFEQIFPPATVTDLLNMTNGFYKFISTLKMGEVDLFNLKQTLKGVFAIFSIGWSILKGLGGMLRDLFNRFAENHSGLLEFTAGIGDWLVNLDWAIKKGDDLGKFFDDLGNLIAVPIKLLQAFGRFLKDAFDGVDMSEVQTFFSGLGSSFAPLTQMGSSVSGAWNGVLEVLQKVWAFFEPIIAKVAAGFSWLGDRVKDAFAKMDLKNLFAAGNLAMQGGILAMIYKFVKTFTENAEDLKKANLKQTFIDVLGAVKGQLEAMQASVKADMILKIAAAVALLALSVVMLSMVKPAELSAALLAMGAMFAMLLGFMKSMEVFLKGGGSLKLPFVAAGLILLAIAVGVLAVALRILSGLSWEEMAKGLVGVGGILVGLALFTKFADVSKGGIKAGAGLILLAVAINIMAGAIAILGYMDIAKLLQGVQALGIVLTMLAVFVNVTSGTKGIFMAAAGLLVLSVALNIIAGALMLFGTMSWDSLGRGLVGMAGALLIITAAVNMMPKTMILQAAGLLVISSALAAIAGVLMLLGGMSWDSVAKGMTALAGTLMLLALALNLMNGAIVGAAALIVAAIALSILAPVLLLFSKMSWEEIGKGLLMLAGVFVVLGLAGLVLAPIVVVLLAVGAAVLLLGLGVLIAGQGVLMLAAGLIALTAAVAGGTGAMTLAMMAILSLIPYAMEQLGLGIIAMVNVIAASSSALLAAFVTILLALITAVNIVAPPLIACLVNLILLLVAAVVRLVPRLVDAGMKLIVGLLRGIADNLEDVIDAATDVVIAFIKGIGKNSLRIINAGADVLIEFLKGLAKAIRDKSKQINDAGWDIADAIIDGVVDGIGGGLSMVARAAAKIGESALRAIEKALGIASPSKEARKLAGFVPEGAALGITDKIGMVETAATVLGVKALSSLRKAMSSAREAVSGEVDMTPRIRPVLDLTDVKKEAATLSALMGPQAIAIDKAYKAASNIAVAERARVEQTVEVAPVNQTVNTIEYTQNNYSPKALSSVDIYRQTNNQLSTIKEALPV